MASPTARFYYKGDRIKPLRAFCQTARLGSVSRAYYDPASEKVIIRWFRQGREAGQDNQLGAHR